MTVYTTTVTATTSADNTLTVTTVANMTIGMPITFSGVVFGGITTGSTYYILQVVTANTIKISSLPGGAIFAVTTGTGTMTATFTAGGQYIIDTTPPGEPLESAFNKVNVNFDQIFAAGPVGSNIAIANNTIRTLNTNGNLVLAPNGIGRVVANVDILPNTANIRNLGSPTARWGSLYVNDLDFSGNLNIANLTVSGNITAANISANVYVGNTVSVTGNISANAYVGNTVSVTGNISANVYVGNTVSVTGNITAASVFGNIVGPIPASSRIIYVAKNGNDANDGGFNAPFLTIRAAMAVATAGTSVHVAPGAYTEINPITIPTNVAMIGDNLRSVFVTPANPSANLFYMRGGTYVWGFTIRDYLANGFSYDPATPTQNVFISPYIQNITSSTTTGTAVFIDGNATSAISTKAMILGFFTIINRGGRGVYLVNSAYSQAVNIYTIACDIGLKVESGAFVTLNGSDCSIGNFGLIADGVGPLQTTANVVTDFQGLFKLQNLPVGNVAATQIQPGSTCTIVTQGTTDFVAIGAANNNPGTVFVAVATGTGTGVVSTPTRPNVNTIMRIAGDPENYTIGDIVPIPGEPANVLVQVQQTYLGNAPPGTAVTFNVRSSIIASAHTFEYVGAGTNPATALPQYGGIPIEANEVIQTNGGVVTFTSTDQKGNFKVGQGFTINQATSQITGDAFYRSLFAQMTPYILALST
jgi:hypothetical protein